MRIFKGLVRVCVGFGLLVLLGSYLGALHPLGDSLAVFRVWIAYGVGAVGVIAIVMRAWKVGVSAVVLAASAVLHIASFNDFVTRPIPAEPDLIVYTKNLAARWGDQAAIARDIAEFGADVVLLQELVPETIEALPTLLPDHPYQHICVFSEWSAMAVASRYPLSAPGCTDHRSLAYAVVDAPSGPIWVASVHQVWPYPHEQAALLPDILAAVEGSPARRVVAGDFNMVPWGNSVRQIMEAGDMQRISPFLPTIEVRGVEMSIDHVLTDGEGMATRSARMGSDHYGMVAWITWE